jgi:serine/threonine protein kinase
LEIVVAEGVLRSAPNCRVAIKKQAKEFIFDHATMLRTREQADILRKLAHEHIVPLVDEYEDDSAFFLVMPFASAGSLFSRVRNKTLTEFETRNFTSQALSALEHVHKLGVVHTDVKPHNFLLNRIDGRFHVWLCDFGLADPLRPDGSVGFAGLRGTSGYFAPEMMKQQDYGPAVDIFALGVTMHNLLLGYTPFDPPSNFEELDFDPRYWKHMSDESRDMLVGMLDLDPAKRLTATAAAEHAWFSADVTEEQKVEKYVPPPDASLKFHAAGSVPPLPGLPQLMGRDKDHLANPNEPEDVTSLPIERERSLIKTVATAPGPLARCGSFDYEPPVRSASNHRLVDLGSSR